MVAQHSEPNLYRAQSLNRMLTIFGQEESGSCLVSHTLMRRAGGRQWRLVLATLTSPKSHFRTALLLALTLSFPILPFSAAEQSGVSALFLEQCSPREGYVLPCVRGDECWSATQLLSYSEVTQGTRRLHQLIRHLRF